MNTEQCILHRDSNEFQNWLISLIDTGTDWQQAVQQLREHYGAVLEPEANPETILEISYDNNRLVFKSNAYLTLFKLQYMIPRPRLRNPCKAITIKPHYTNYAY